MTLSNPTDGNNDREDILSEESIRLMVDTFYNKVRQDDLIGPIFERVVNDWDTHLPTMYQFWQKLLFDTGDYSGNPYQKHLALPVEKAHFTRWLKLFSSTIDDKFRGPMAEEAKRLAKNIACSFQIRMDIQPEKIEPGAVNYSRG